MEYPTACPVCGTTPVERWNEGASTMSQVKCKVCGRYSMSHQMELTFPKVPAEDPKTFLPAYIRQANLRGETPTFLSSTNWEKLASGHMHTPVAVKLTKILEYLARRSAYPGDRIEVFWNDEYPLFDARSNEEMPFLLFSLEERKDIATYKDMATVGERRWALTAAGWARLDRTEPGGVPGTCFVAMAFADELKPAYDDGIELAVAQDCKLNVVRLDRIEHNGIVDDVMLAEIRGCQLLVADVTMQRNGAYFEAGFALGLGRTVIWCVREDEITKVHFDTRQYSHVVWKDPADLRERLRNRIRATVQIAASIK